MTTNQLARRLDAIPVVVDTADRDSRFANPEWHQRVDNLALGYVERWSGTAWVPDWNYVGGFNAKAFGAVGDGVADDTAALQATVAAALAVNGVAYVPAGVYRYSARFAEITNRMALVGAGKRVTIFKPLSSYTGFGIRVNDTWRNNAEDAAGKVTVDYANTRAGVTLQGFSMIGDRTYTCRGIQTYDRVDHLVLRDVELEYLNGTALQLGVEASVNAIVRECVFFNLRIYNSGNSTEPALDITNGDTAGDGTNQLDFYNLGLVYNFGVAMKIHSNVADTFKNVRRFNFAGAMVHGRNNLADAPFCDLVQIAGDVKNVYTYGWMTNGSHKADTALASNITNVATSVPLVTGTGATHFGQQPAFPYPVYITDGTNSETMSVTGRTTDTLTVTRAQEGTSAFAFNAAVLTSSLASNLSATATTLALNPGDGALFPSPSGITVKHYLVKLTDGTNTEYCLVTKRATDTLTIQRGKCGTTGTAFLAATPTVVTLLSTVTMRYAALRISPQTNNDASIDKPQYSTFDMDLRTCQGHGIVQELGSAIEYTGKVQVVDIPGNECRIQNSAAVADGRYALRGSGTRSIFLGTTNKAMKWQDATQPVDGWYQMNVPGTQAVTELTRGAGRWVAKVDGSVTEIWLKLSEARTAGTLTLTLYKNTGLGGASGSATALVATINASATSFAQGFAAPFVYTYSEGDELYLALTSASWTPTTSDVMNAGFSFMDT